MSTQNGVTAMPAPPKEESQSPSRSNGGRGEERSSIPHPPSSSSGHRPHSAQSTQSSHSSSSSSKHVKCIGRYVLTGQSLGKGNFARVEAAVHTLTRAKVSLFWCLMSQYSQRMHPHSNMYIKHTSCYHDGLYAKYYNVYKESIIEPNNISKHINSTYNYT